MLGLRICVFILITGLFGLTILSRLEGMWWVGFHRIGSSAITVGFCYVMQAIGFLILGCLAFICLAVFGVIVICSFVGLLFLFIEDFGRVFGLN
jgi:hypothetical protein